MTLFLASVASLAEAQIAVAEGADIVDLKAPHRGALGALPLADVERIVNALAGGVPLSATVGDIPADRGVLTAAVTAMSHTGIDFVKVGFFPGGDWFDAAASLGKLAGTRAQLIAVLFADLPWPPGFVKSLAAFGFQGVMVDTMDKTSPSLTRLWPRAALAQFVDEARDSRLLCGLAGSLSLADIPHLCALNPDYLGFRGALCPMHARTAGIDSAHVRAVRQALPQVAYAV